MSIPALPVLPPRAARPAESPMFDVQRVRDDFFPTCVRRRARQGRSFYLDNAATSQNRAPVLDALPAYYRPTTPDVHRGVHLLSERATQDTKAPGPRSGTFLNRRRRPRIVFVRGATGGDHLVAQNVWRKNIREGDGRCFITAMDTTPNIVPWQMLCEEKGARAARGPDQRRRRIAPRRVRDSC